MITVQQQNIEHFYYNIMAYPQNWPNWPFLSMVRGTSTNPHELEVGMLFDVFHLTGYQWKMPGFSATVFKQNFLLLPKGTTVADILSLPQEMYDTSSEILAVGWRPDLY